MYPVSFRLDIKLYICYILFYETILWNRMLTEADTLLSGSFAGRKLLGIKVARVVCQEFVTFNMGNVDTVWVLIVSTIPA